MVSDIIDVSAKHISWVDIYVKFVFVILTSSGIDICSCIIFVRSYDGAFFCSYVIDIWWDSFLRIDDSLDRVRV